MKKSSFCTLIVFSLIIIQLCVSASLIKGDLTPAAILNENPQNQSFFPYAPNTLMQDLSCSYNPNHNPFDQCFCDKCTVVHHITVTPKNATIKANESQTYQATAYDSCGHGWDITTSKDIVWSINSGEGTYVWTANSVQVTKPGTWVVTASYCDKNGTATLVVKDTNVQKLDHITASINPTTVEAPGNAVGTATAYDIHGKSWDVSALATWIILSGGDGGVWQQNVYTSNTAGVYTVQATYQGKTATANLTVTHATNPSYIDHITAQVNPTAIAAPNTATGSATAYDKFGNSWDISTLAAWSIPAGGDGGTWSNNVYASKNAGAYTVQASYSGKTATASLTVTHATDIAYLDHITASLSPTTVAAPNTVTGTATAYDTFGNSWDISTQAAWSLPKGGDGGSWSSNIYTSHTAGSYLVQASYNGKTATADLTVTHATDQAHLAYITARVNPTTVAAPGKVTGAARAFDTFGNSWDVSTSATWGIAAGNDGGSWQQNIYTSSKAGNYTVQAAYLGKTATAELKVTHATDFAYLDRIVASVSPSTVAAPNQATGKAIATDQFGNSWDVSAVATWSIPAGGDGGSWNSNVYTSHTAGNYVIQAAYGGKTATAALTVTHATDPVYLDHITVSLNPTTVSAPNTVTGTATAYDTFGNSWDISTQAAWSIPAGNDGGSWLKNIYTSNKAGTYTAQATYGGKSASASLTVTHATDIAYLAFITASVNPTKVAAPNTVTGTATATDIYGNSWDISTAAIWSIPSGGDGGVWQQNVYTSNTAGVYTVQASYGGKSANADLTVTHASDVSYLDHIVASINPTTVAAPDHATGKATAHDKFGNSWDISTLAAWSIPVGNDGGVWAKNVYTSKTAGNYTVEASYSGKTATTTLTVTHATDTAYLDHIAASLSPATVAAPNKVTGKATAYDTFGNSWDISSQATWSIPKGGDGGSWDANVYTSHTAGNYTIQAAYSGKTASVALEVTHAVDGAYLDRIVIAPKESTVDRGVAQYYSATAFDNFGNSWAVEAAYSCPNSNVVVSGNSARSSINGQYTITGVYSGKSDSAILNVVGQSSSSDSGSGSSSGVGTIKSIVVLPASSSVAAGGSMTFVALASDGHTSWSVTGKVTWSIDASAGGSWNQATGTYTSSKAGNWTVKATLGSVYGNARLMVNSSSAVVDHIAISPKKASVAAGVAQNYTVTAYDKEGNSLGDVTALSNFSAAGALVEGNSVRASSAGSYNVTAAYEGLVDVAVLTVTEQSVNLYLYLEAVLLALAGLLAGLGAFRYYGVRRRRRLNRSEPAVDAAGQI
ncbi:MAG: hypothetical protein NWE93_10765 [Candidatus Bathyarchaeota archaeon]|nr:hypothetical protein [Candidatus Bathyarchaeota archaeon]